MNTDTEQKIREAAEEAIADGMDEVTVVAEMKRIVREVTETRTQAAAAAVFARKS